MFFIPLFARLQETILSYVTYQFLLSPHFLVLLILHLLNSFLPSVVLTSGNPFPNDIIRIMSLSLTLSSCSDWWRVDWRSYHMRGMCWWGDQEVVECWASCEEWSLGRKPSSFLDILRFRFTNSSIVPSWLDFLLVTAFSPSTSDSSPSVLLATTYSMRQSHSEEGDQSRV